jgi:Pentapeptide repeats (8 copies)
VSEWEWFAYAWKWYSTNRADLTPIGAFLGGLVIAYAALRQAHIAARRHYAQTEADRQRRITESFSKAIEQVGSDKTETRLGGIYTLERISHESGADYWTVMETLTAFVRERARWKKPDASASETMAVFCEDKRPSTTQTNHEPATDIAAVLSVIIRRDKKNRDRERIENWRFDLRGSDLRNALFMGAHLEGANLSEAHLERTNFVTARLEGANLSEAHLERADLSGAHLERAYLIAAYLEGAVGLDGPAAHTQGQQ